MHIGPDWLKCSGEYQPGTLSISVCILTCFPEMPVPAPMSRMTTLSLLLGNSSFMAFSRTVSAP